MDEYVNRNSLRDSVYESLKENPHDDQKIYQNHIYEHQHFLNLIDREPVEDVAPVRHGRVVTTSDRWHVFHQNCSECGADLPWKEYPNYCYNCGAKLDLEEQENEQ